MIESSSSSASSRLTRRACRLVRYRGRRTTSRLVIRVAGKMRFVRVRGSNSKFTDCAQQWKWTRLGGSADMSPEYMHSNDDFVQWWNDAKSLCQVIVRYNTSDGKGYTFYRSHE